MHDCSSAGSATPTEFEVHNHMNLSHKALRTLIINSIIFTESKMRDPET